MATKHFRFYGTRDEINAARTGLHARASDKILEECPLFNHMNVHLGLEIWVLCISKVDFSSAVASSIDRLLAQFPNLLYQATWKDGRVIDNGIQKFTNFNQEDENFPGPFGALCKVYGKTYYDRPDTKDLVQSEMYDVEIILDDVPTVLVY